MEIEIQGTNYEFIIDTGADVCLVQPYVGDEPTEEMRDAVRGITGQELEIEGSRQLDFIIGIRSYSHNFVVAPFSMKKDGIIGLNLLNKLNASINIPAREINLDGQQLS
jgi:predicted aspartyl protease